MTALLVAAAGVVAAAVLVARVRAAGRRLDEALDLILGPYCPISGCRERVFPRDRVDHQAAHLSSDLKDHS